ncbi:IS3 family transposase [Glycomyces albidus]|uniref:IS3 family transposase n=1 Tax=Glycomyces albidus TaxID=2656774 RepID=UPI00128FD147|nr:IS3 family transposase [Glycomyces albidus]
MKTRAVAALKAEFPLPVLLRVAGLARSTFFYHQARIGRPDPKQALKDAIRTAFAEAGGRYGHRRLHTVLVRQGWTVAKKTVLALMRVMELRCGVRRRRHPFKSYQGQTGLTAPNRLDRDFTADAPNRKWVTDVTEFAIDGRRVYLSPIIDLFDRSVVAYAIGPSPNLALTLASLRDATATLAEGEHPLVHSDQGFQYQHASWRRLLATHGLTQSMSRKGNCLDNAIAEGFFGHLKSEIFQSGHPQTAYQLTIAIKEYIRWYNTERIHTRLEGLTPAAYRAQTLMA